MARINAYPRDLAIGGSEVLLGSDSDGSTKTFSINDLKDFLISQGISGDIGYKFDSVTATNNLGAGTFKANSTTFASVNKLSIHNSYITGSDVQTYLNSFLGEEIILFNIKNRNNFARFLFEDSYSVNSDNNSLRDITVSHVSSNGVFQQNEFYDFGFEGKDKNYTHNQNNASTTWSINHNLNKFPSVSLKFSSSDNIYQNVGAFAGVVYTDKDNLTINLVTAESGYAYLN